jgi:hypothetical protein
MTDYVKLRASALKASLGVALAALIGGLPARAHAAPAAPSTGSTKFLKLEGLGRDVRNAFLKVEDQVLKLESSLANVEHKLARNDVSKTQANATFLKIKSADSSFLKIKSANASFLKIDDANSTFLKIDDANASFLKVDGTAANASELGGASPQSYSRSAAGDAVVTPGGPAQPLLPIPGGALTVQAGYGGPIGVGPSPFVSITNGSGQALPAVQDLDGQTTSADLAAGVAEIIALQSVAQLHVQFFSVPGLFGSAQGEPATLIVSVEPEGNAFRFVGQLLAGSM